MNPKKYSYILVAYIFCLLTGCGAFDTSETSHSQKINLSAEEVRKEVRSLFAVDADSSALKDDGQSTLKSFLHSDSVEIRRNLAGGLCDIAREGSHKMWEELVSDYVRPFLTRLIKDSNDEVRRETACILHQLVFQGSEGAIRLKYSLLGGDFLPVIVNCLNDSNVEVRKIISRILFELHCSTCWYTCEGKFDYDRTDIHPLVSIWAEYGDWVKDTDTQVRRNLAKLFRNIAQMGNCEERSELLSDALRPTLICLLEEDDLLARKDVEFMLYYFARDRDDGVRERMRSHGLRELLSRFNRDKRTGRENSDYIWRMVLR